MCGGLLAVAALLTSHEASAAAGQVEQLGRPHTSGDFDNDGLVDRAFGYPGVHGTRGSVVVVYGDGGVEEINRATSGILDGHYTGDFFGDSLSAGDIDGDGYEDLVVGVPGDDVTVFAWNGSTTHTDAGSIHVIYGSSNGLTDVGDQIVDRVSDGLDANVDVEDRFGETVAVADFNCDGYEDVAVGVPYDDAQSGRTDDGSIHVIYGTPSGLTSVDDFFHQGTPNVSGAPESNDEFGASLAVGNFDGDASGCMDLAVGVVGENTDGGYIVFFYGAFFGDFSFSNKTGLSQNRTDDSLEAWDAFGAQMWAFDDNGDAYDDLMVAVPGETCDDGREAGFHRFRGHTAGLVSNNALNNSTHVLECMDWDELAVQEAVERYRKCVDFAEPDCGEGLTSDFQALDRDWQTEYVTACEVGLEFALDACEHWITDPICDVDLCIAAAHELSSVALGCIHEGDVLTHGY